MTMLVTYARSKKDISLRYCYGKKKKFIWWCHFFFVVFPNFIPVKIFYSIVIVAA